MLNTLLVTLLPVCRRLGKNAADRRSERGVVVPAKRVFENGFANAGASSTGSVIVSPGGEVIDGPLSGAGLLYAEMDLKEVMRGKFDLDVVGHYSRPQHL